MVLHKADKDFLLIALLSDRHRTERVPRRRRDGDIDTRLCRDAEDVHGMLSRARSSRPWSAFHLCVVVAFAARFSSSGGCRGSGKGRAGGLAADGFIRESRIRVVLV